MSLTVSDDIGSFHSPLPVRLLKGPWGAQGFRERPGFKEVIVLVTDHEGKANWLAAP